MADVPVAFRFGADKLIPPACGYAADAAGLCRPSSGLARLADIRLEGRRAGQLAVNAF